MGPESFRKARPYRAWHRVLVLVVGRLWRLLRVGHVAFRAFHHRLSKRSQFSKSIHWVNAAFPLSDHADYNDLVRYVNLVRPKRVLTLHGFAAEFARDLRERGVEAWALT